MASLCNRLINRVSVSSIRSVVKSSGLKPSASRSAATPSPAGLPPPPRPSTTFRQVSLSRCPSELACVQSLLPLHSAVAAARMTSCLSTNSRSCRALSQDGADGT